jgi:precorrin-3B synthase
VHQPFLESDGALVRIRVAGGRLTADQVIQVAEAGQAAGATMEITSRSNLQLRAIDPGRLGSLTAALLEAGVAPDSGPPVAGPYSGPGDVLTSPTTGFDRYELLDTCQLAGQARALLAARGTAGAVSPKFGIVLDGGGEVNVRGRRQDLVLGAAMVAGRLRFELRVGESLAGPGDSDSSRAVVTVPVERALAVIEAAVGMAAAAPGSGRLDGWIERLGRSEVLVRIARIAGLAAAEVDIADISRTTNTAATTLAPVGALAQRQPGVVAVGAMPVLGRLAPADFGAVGRLAQRAGGEVRLSPWRSLLIPGVAPSTVDAMLARLSELSFACYPGDPALGVVACAGAAGCPSGLADTQADGRRLIAALRDRASSEPADESVTVHLSGCPKRCAGREGHDLTLVAGPDRDTYALHRTAAGRGGRAGRAFSAAGPLGDPIVSGADASTAIAAVVAAGCAP